ncbi:hypothetical protein OUZ56_029878 [Daphnia magna]|uniref:Uncharacterized protein n=1 Tax=Daphnia magna TaxID=35525 RepID=A0ABR0B840_9CRUS|nr:hypothetical protein OUZ56_029878 [Daphnia magna]
MALIAIVFNVLISRHTINLFSLHRSQGLLTLYVIDVSFLKYSYCLGSYHTLIRRSNYTYDPRRKLKLTVFLGLGGEFSK